MAQTIFTAYPRTLPLKKLANVAPGSQVRKHLLNAVHASKKQGSRHTKNRICLHHSILLIRQILSLYTIKMSIPLFTTTSGTIITLHMQHHAPEACNTMGASQGW